MFVKKSLFDIFQIIIVVSISGTSLLVLGIEKNSFPTGTSLSCFSCLFIWAININGPSILVFGQYSHLSLLERSTGQTLLLMYPVPEKISKIWIVKDDPAQSFLKMLNRARNQTWFSDEYLFSCGETVQFLLNTGYSQFLQVKRQIQF